MVCVVYSHQGGTREGIGAESSSASSVGHSVMLVTNVQGGFVFHARLAQ